MRNINLKETKTIPPYTSSKTLKHQAYDIKTLRTKKDADKCWNIYRQKSKRVVQLHLLIKHIQRYG